MEPRFALRERHHVESNVEISWMAGQIMASRSGDLCPLLIRDRLLRRAVVMGSPRLNLHKDQTVTVARDQINFAASPSVVLGQNPKTLLAQERGGTCLRISSFVYSVSPALQNGS